MQQLIQVTQNKTSAELQTIEYRRELEAVINHLIQTDFAALVNGLYKIDVSEKDVKEALSKHPAADAATIIADKIMERQLQKQKQKTFTRDENIPDEDKW